MRTRAQMIGFGLGAACMGLLVATLTCNDPFATEARKTDSGVNSTGANTSALVGLPLYGMPDSRALTTVASWERTRPADAKLIDSLARTPQGVWFNGWQPDPRAAADQLVADAAERGGVPLIVVYNIPSRDCGEYSAGGAATPAAYRSFVESIAAGIGGRRAIVVLEPDALAGMDCLGASARTERLAMLSDAVAVLGDAGAWVYIDAGHPHWHSAEEVARRLIAAGVEKAAGFALNVSNFYPTADNVAFGDAVSRRIGGKHYTIDTSRNGRGAAVPDAWCNPPGRGVGDYPTTSTGLALVDALLWVKNPGDSDGPCNGGPEAGEWWPDYALGLMQRGPTTLR